MLFHISQKHTSYIQERGLKPLKKRRMINIRGTQVRFKNVTGTRSERNPQKNISSTNPTIKQLNAINLENHKTKREGVLAFQRTCRVQTARLAAYFYIEQHGIIKDGR